MIRDKDVRCSNCKSWLPFKAFEVAGLCLIKCKWILDHQVKAIAEIRDPFKGASQWCSAFRNKD